MSGYCIRGVKTHLLKMKDCIPFNKPFIAGKELSNIAQAVEEYNSLAGNGHFTGLCQSWFESTLDSPKALLTHSCTAALEMAAILCDIGPGDEVVMPSFTFVSTANAFVLRGGVPVFVDIRPDTLNIDEQKIERAITGKTKAIVPVHYAGGPCAMDKILQIAKTHNLWVIEDAAHALLSKYKDRYLGTIGHMGVLSFHETKNIISGVGGALLINNENFLKRAEVIWEKGTNRQQFFRGEVEKYTWVDVGSSFLPGEITAAFLYAQLQMAKTIIDARKRVFQLYYKFLEPVLSRKCIRLPLPLIEEKNEANGHLFYIITNSHQERTRLIQHLKADGISAVFHYVPLHSSPAGKKYGRTSGDLKVTDELSEKILRLPLFYEIEEEQVRRVADSIINFYLS